MNRFHFAGIMFAAAFATACSSASAAVNDSLCGDRIPDSVIIEQDAFDPPKWIMPDLGRDDPNEPAQWLDLRAESPKTLTLHCNFNRAWTDVKKVKINSAKSCTWESLTGKVWCK